MNVVTGYIPAEILTCCVAVLAALNSSPKPMLKAEWIAFWIFLVATPVVFWLVYATKIKEAGKKYPSGEGPTGRSFPPVDTGLGFRGS